jgi:hypothetical protein
MPQTKTPAGALRTDGGDRVDVARRRRSWVQAAGVAPRTRDRIQSPLCGFGKSKDYATAAGSTGRYRVFCYLECWDHGLVRGIGAVFAAIP